MNEKEMFSLLNVILTPSSLQIFVTFTSLTLTHAHKHKTNKHYKDPEEEQESGP